MAAWTIAAAVVQSIWGRKRAGPEYEAINLDPEQNRVRGRSSRRGYHQYRWHITLLVYLSLSFCGLFMLSTYEQPADIRYRPDILAALKSPKPEGHGNGEKVFIGAMFYNNQKVIPYWSDEMIKLIKYLGTDNVFVSIVESNSGDNTPSLMDTATPRIQFLADVRNKVMEPLVEKGYDRAIFSNDIFIEAESILELLKTEDGKFDMACGIDLSYWGMYDSWVVRDRLGRLVSSLWPYFLEDAGMQAVMADEPAPVFSCWNGIVAFRPDPFLPDVSLSPAHMPPLSFRPSTDKECFSSESSLCLTICDAIHVLRHWMVKWWIENVENGSRMHLAKMVIGDAKNIWRWDGGECQPDNMGRLSLVSANVLLMSQMISTERLPKDTLPSVLVNRSETWAQ
ncbi:hypothetical protein BDZ89DRAFT_1079471 [Hymenopellis radicata]|nr:hypothetical protein BDZ89DRAFT_1082543 [Hymenopellis radicata]KAF9007296.1 hypothetical protein BDZ89DRAFT_1079471 [Hymenopellis radicata]